MSVLQWYYSNGAHYPVGDVSAYCCVMCISRAKRLWRAGVAARGEEPLLFRGDFSSLKAAKAAAETWLVQLKLEGKI
jgi:hypothetical protein